LKITLTIHTQYDYCAIVRSVLARPALSMDTSHMTIRKTVKHLFVALTLMALVIANSIVPSNAASKSRNLSASNLVTVSYPLLVSIPKNGCGKVPVKYKVNKLPIDESAFFLVIEDDQDRLIGQAAWFGTNYEGSVKAMPKSGTLNIKVCRDMWTDQEEETTFYPAYRGTYTLFLSAVGDMSAEAKASFKIS
jgi:hypothetical protein